MNYRENKMCIYVKIKFFEAKRMTKISFSAGNYRPHFVIKNDSKYLGVQFVD